MLNLNWCLAEDFAANSYNNASDGNLAPGAACRFDHVPQETAATGHLCQAAVDPLSQETLKDYLEKRAPFDFILLDVRSSEEISTDSNDSTDFLKCF